MRETSADLDSETTCTPSTSTAFVDQIQSDSISTTAAWNSSSRAAVGIPSHVSRRPFREQRPQRRQLRGIDGGRQ